MENQQNDNLNLPEAVVQNTEMGKNTLEHPFRRHARIGNG